MPTRTGAAWLSLAAIALVAIGVRLPGFATVPLWTDELFTRFYPDAGWAHLWGPGLRAEPTAPLYYSLIWAVERVLGSQAWALRMPSLLASLASVWLAWSLGRELFGPRAAGLAALLLALAPVNVFYAQEARSYALQGAALGLALLGAARFLRDGRWPIAYAAGALLAAWLHPTSAVALLAVNVAILVGMPGRAALWRWLAANALVGAAYLPLLPALLAPPGSGAATNWIPPLTRWSLEGVIGQTLGGPALEPHSLRVAELGVLALGALVLIPPWRPGRRALLLLALAPGLALALMIGISAVKPILLGRTLAWLLLPLAVALGDILSRRWPVVAAATLALAAAALTVQWTRAPTLKENWPALFAHMPTLDPADLLVLAPRSPPAAVAVYAPGAPTPVRLDDGGPPTPETTVMPRLFGTAAVALPDVAAAIAAGRPVWLVYRRPEYAWVQREIAALPPPSRAVQSEPGPNPALRALQWAR